MYPKLFGLIPTYPLMWMIGALFLYLFLELYLRKVRLPRGLITGIEILGLTSILSGILSGLLFQNLYDYLADPNHYSWSWDMTFYGGLIGGVLSFLLLDFLWLKKQYGPHLGAVLQIAPSGITIMHAWGRIGCFLNGCCYGLPSDAWYAIRFTTTETKVLPVNLWEAIFLFLLSLLLFLSLYFRNFRYGFPLYLLSYSVWRFAIEYLRGDERGSFIPGLSPSQFWSILMFAAGILYFILQLIFEKRGKQVSINQTDENKTEK